MPKANNAEEEWESPNLLAFVPEMMWVRPKGTSVKWVDHLTKFGGAVKVEIDTLVNN